MDPAPLEPIPKPELLDPDRPLTNLRSPEAGRDDRPEPELIADALHESCAYANQLWNHLDAVRRYLLDSLPPDPGTAIKGAAPTAPEHEKGWQTWIDTFSAVTSVLCGPHGDSGFGLSRANHEAQLRRSIPEPHSSGLAQSDLVRGAAPAAVPDPDPDPALRAAVAADTVGTPLAADHRTGATGNHRRRIARLASLAIVVAFALRGLRPRNPSDRNDHSATRVPLAADTATAPVDVRSEAYM